MTSQELPRGFIDPDLLVAQMAAALDSYAPEDPQFDAARSRVEMVAASDESRRIKVAKLGESGIEALGGVYPKTMIIDSEQRYLEWRAAARFVPREADTEKN